MATSGYRDVAATYTTSGNVGDTLRFKWEQVSQDIEKNTTTIKWSLLLIAGGAGYISSSVSKKWTVTIDGTTYTGTTTVGIANNATKTLASGTHTISHASDGTKIFSVSFSQVFNITFNSYVGTISSSASFTLNTIPRATTPTLSPTTVVMGEILTITLSRASESFTHTLQHDFYVGSWTTFATDVEETATLETPESWATGIPNDVSGSGRIRCLTYNGDTLIGEKIVTFTATVPDSIIPTVDSITVSEAVDGLADKFGAFIQNKSKLQVVTSASGASGSTIKSCKVEVAGIAYSGTEIVTEPISQNGNLLITVTVTDSRGRTDTGTTNVTVLEYFLPTIEQFDAYRSDEDGNEKNSSKILTCAYKFQVAPCGGKNDKNYKIEYRRTGTSEWTTLEKGSVFSADTKLIKTDALALEYSYEVRLTVSDYFDTPATYPVRVGMEVVVWCPYPTGKGLGIGGYPTGEYLDVFMDALFKGDMKLVDETAGTEMNLAYTIATLKELTEGKYYSGYTDEVEIINSTAYHGMKNGTLNNGYEDLFIQDEGGAYFTYQGSKPCILSGMINAKIVQEGSDYVHIFSGIQGKEDEGGHTAITPYVDESGRWYALPIHLVMEQGDKFYFLYTHSESAYLKVEHMHFQMRIDGYIGAFGN